MNQSIEFKDPLGRPSDKPDNVEYGITDNALLFTGEYALLMSYLSKLDFGVYSFLVQVLEDSLVQKGLHTRHPQSLMKTYNIAPNKMSHDEMNGIAFISVACPALSTYTKDMMTYLEAHHNQYYDLEPESDFIKALRSDPIDALKKLYAYYKDYKSNPQDTNSVDLRHDGNISALSSWKMPRDIAFYTLAAGKKPSLFSTMFLGLSTILSARRNIHDGSRGGTMLMVWFRNLALKKLKIRGLNRWILSQSMRLFDMMLIKKYGKRYPEVLINSYFDRVGDNGERHHMIHLVRLLLDKNKNI